MNDLLRSRIVPVLDLKDGHVVRGVGGRRDAYKPVVSRWTRSSAPLEIARALRNQFGFTRLYVADLGAICDRQPHIDAIESLLADGFCMDLDCGVRHAEDLAAIPRGAGARIIVGLETLEAPAQLRRLVDAADGAQTVFSLDLMQGRPLGNHNWPVSIADIVGRVHSAGVTSLIVLDLAAVGTGAGCPTLPICRAIRSAFPGFELITGGGVRSGADVEQTVEAGADLVLVASALHDGRIE